MATATYVPISTTTLGSNSTSITFSSIPQTYTDLRVVINGLVYSGGNCTVQYNGVTSNYTYMNLYGAPDNSGYPYGALGSGSGGIVGYINGVMTHPFLLLHDINSYQSGYTKSIGRWSSDQNQINAVQSIDFTSMVYFNNSSAITSITYNGWFKSGTTATLYGIKAS